MSIVSLLGTPQQRLMDILIAENPGLAQFPLDWFRLGEPRQQVGTRTALTLVGRAGKKSEPLLSGVQTVFYNRVDLDQLTFQVKPIQVHGAQTKHAMLHSVASQLGIELSPDLVQDGPLDTEADYVVLDFQNHKYLLMQDSLTLPMSWVSTIDLASVFHQHMLNGYDLPWPYLISLAEIFTVPLLAGYAMPDLIMSMPEISKHWVASTQSSRDWCASRVVDGVYSPSLLVDVMNAVTQSAYPWQCVLNESTEWNLWNARIVYNGPSEPGAPEPYVIRLLPSGVYFHEGVGEISIHYTP